MSKRPHVLLWAAAACALLDGAVEILLRAEEKRANQPEPFIWKDKNRWEKD